MCLKLIFSNLNRLPAFDIFIIVIITTGVIVAIAASEITISKFGSKFVKKRYCITFARKIPGMTYTPHRRSAKIFAPKARNINDLKFSMRVPKNTETRIETKTNRKALMLFLSIFIDEKDSLVKLD